VSIATTDQRIWADAISAFMQQNPDVMVSHENLGLNQFENSDLLQRFDFILCLESALEDKHFVSRVLFSSNSLMLVVPKIIRWRRANRCGSTSCGMNAF
jgi:DNA-binding transcriptional LysR family regulator